MLAGLAVAAAIMVGGPAGALAHTDYTIQRGEALEQIARRHSTTVSAIARENGIDNPDRIVAGRTLTIPDGAGGATASGGQDGAGATHHVVRSGESLSTIGQRFGVPVATLAEWNGLPSVHMVMAGSRISVGGPASHAAAPASGGAGTHRIAPGETLSGIATRSGVSVVELARVNEITDPNRIVAGRTLRLPGGGGWHCPVRGPARFVNDYGITKPSGRFHEGVDLYAERGTAVVAPVAGQVSHVIGHVAGLQFTLRGVDGNIYIGTHLDTLGASGQVGAGDVLGTVGSTGNAVGTAPHLHFEIHEHGVRTLNPYQSLRAACG
jgi:murein DD-endopeptidase MepM/ murein hydrolase activator NlpD